MAPTINHPDVVRVPVAVFVSDPAVFAPRLTGGAVDVCLVDREGRRLKMRGSGYDEKARMDATGLSAEVRHNRDTLASAMAGAGFVHYPHEWWHWSYGDKYWAHATGTTAIYGPATLGVSRRMLLGGRRVRSRLMNGARSIRRRIARPIA